MATRKHLIVGCGPAALNAVARLRLLAPQDEIRMVCMEDYPPYSPTSLTYYLAGRIVEDKLWTASASRLEQLGCRFSGNSEVVRILPASKQVLYRDGSSESYDTLLIATGAAADVPRAPGVTRDNTLVLRTLDDAKTVLSAADGRNRAVIWGAGLIALQAASSLLQRGLEVTVVARSRPLRRYLDERAAKMVQDVYEKNGVRMLTGTNVERVESLGNQHGITLTSGERLEADLFVAGLGVKPRVEFLADSGIQILQGIVVDRHMQTSVPDVYAAGDVAESPEFFTGKPGLNPIVPSAVRQGKVAASNMAGRDEEYEGWIGMNLFQFFGNSTLSLGVDQPLSPEGSVQEDVETSANRFKKMIFQGDHLVGAMMLNVPVDPGVMLYLIRNKVPLGALAPILFEQPREISRLLMMEEERKGTVVAEEEQKLWAERQ